MPDPIQLAISAMVDHIRNHVPDLRACLKGWPDPGERLVLPSAAATHGDPERVGHEAIEIGQTVVPGDAVLIDVAYEVADLTAPVQIDVWGRSRTQRGELAAEIRGLFTDPELGDDLRLTLANYHNRIATFQIERWRDGDDDDAAKRQEWRQTIEITIEVPEVAVKRQPLFTTIDLSVEPYNSDQTMS